jgi:hypothetical protein
MARTKEEIAADLVWQYVEHVRQSEAEGRPACFSRMELDQLVDVLETAAGMPHALTADECEERRAAVRRRVEQMLPPPAAAAPPPQAAPEASAPRRSWLHDFLGGAAVVPAWRFQAATAAALALTCAVVTVNIWHRPAPEVRVVQGRSEAPGDVEPISEQKAHELLPGMVRNRLARQEERNLMWHMLVCPRCYDEYAAMKERERTAFRHGAGVRLISYR